MFEPAAEMNTPETADIETSSEGYAKRFAGPTGAWLLSVQERITLELLGTAATDPRADGTSPKGTVLEVGGGHGQLAAPLVREGWDLTVIGSDESCRTRIAPLVDSGQCRFVAGNLVQLPFPARSFDHVLCFRFVSHCSRWQTLLSELCRVARRSVIIDYPPLSSWNLLTPLLFPLKKKLEGNTRTYGVFRHHEIESVFREQGFSQLTRRGQFFLPMVIHRKLQSPERSEQLEQPFRRLGVVDSVGSPVILRAERDRS